MAPWQVTIGGIPLLLDDEALEVMFCWHWDTLSCEREQSSSPQAPKTGA